MNVFQFSINLVIKKYISLYNKRHIIVPLKKMFNNKVKAVQENENKYKQNQQKNKKSFTKKTREPKLNITEPLFDISKHKRILEQDIRGIELESGEMPELKTICDTDPTYYKVIEGRPIRQFVDVKVYIKNIRDITLYRANAAYLKDLIIHIDTSYVDELKEYDTIYKLFDKTKSNFFQFIAESYDIAIETQNRAEEKSEELANKINQLNSLSFTHVKLNNKIGSLAAVYGPLFRYGQFLDQMSPVWWIAQNNIKSSDDFIKVFDEAESNPTQSFDIYKAYFVHASIKPMIFFKKPEQLIRIFDAIGRQCLNYIQIQDYSASIVKPVLKSRDRLENKLLAEMNEVTDLIVLYEQQVKWMEEKETEYNDKFNKLLFKEFYDLYASYDSTKLFTCVQFIHFRLFQTPGDPRDNITNLVGDIEKLFVNLSFKLDHLDQNVVKAVKYEVFSSDIKVMKTARKAQRILKECDILKKSLISSFEAPRYFNKKMSV